MVIIKRILILLILSVSFFSWVKTVSDSTSANITTRDAPESLQITMRGKHGDESVC